jgi:hypothetical protein
MTELYMAEDAVPGTDASMFIQWKGTDICIDFHCQCGALGHFDGGFAYALRCPNCNSIYELGTQVLARKVEQSSHQPQDLDISDTSNPNDISRWK